MNSEEFGEEVGNIDVVVEERCEPGNILVVDEGYVIIVL